jgi:glutathione S-transferase
MMLPHAARARTTVAPCAEAGQKVQKAAIMKIYDWPIGPYPARIHIALTEKNLQSRVQFEIVNIRKGEHKRAELLSKDYSGTMPVLELDDGAFIAECTAIT